MTVTFQIKGMKQLERALGADIKRASQIAARVVTQQVKNEIAPYPPATEANQPRSWGSHFSIGTRRARNDWYQRHLGRLWVRKDGSIGGPNPKSEMLRKSWAQKKVPYGAILGNKATYAPAVHSHEEQAKFHGARGWVTDAQAVARVQKSGIVDRIVKQVIDRAMKGKR